MKATQVTELFANIKNTFVSFFSILMFVALGIGIFLGISWAGPSLRNAADEIFNKGSFHNFQIQYLYGLTDNNLKELSNIEGVSDIEAAYQSFQTITVGSDKRTVKMQSLTERINTPIVLEGKLPAKPNEIALHAASAKTLGVGIGDTLTFNSDANSADITNPNVDGEANADPDGMKFLTSANFTITALVDNAEYIAHNPLTYGYSNTPSGGVDAIAWAPSSTFDSSAFFNGYPVVIVRCESLQGLDTFSGTYTAESSAIEKRIEELGKKLAIERYDNLHDQVQQQIDDADKKLAEGKQKIADGEKALIDGKATLAREKALARVRLAEAYDTITSGQAAYDAEMADYNDKKQMCDSVTAFLENARNQTASLNSRKKQLDEDLASGKITQEEYDEQFSEIVDEANAMIEPCRQYASELPEITTSNFDIMIPAAQTILDNYRSIPITIDGETITLDEAYQKLAEGEAILNSAGVALQDMWAAYYDGLDEFNDLVAMGEAKIADAERQLEDAKRQVAENEPKLEDAKSKLAGMQKYDWTITNRKYNAGAAEIDVFSSVTTNLSFSMAALFIIVGLLVSYSAVSRIVHEQVTQIGTKKALGLRSKEITTSFLAYSALAVIAGAIIGVLVAVFIVENIIGGALSDKFIMGGYPPYFGVPLFVVVTILELLLVLGASWIACRSILRKHAVDLLKGDEPPAAKAHFYEKWGLWNKLPLFTQTLVNNCINDKRRVFSTIVGVAGCTALIVTAITLNNDVLASYDRHYDNVYKFNVITFVDSSVDGAGDTIEKALQDQGVKTAQVLRRSFVLTQPNGDRGSMRIIVPQNKESFDSLYHVNLVSGKSYSSSDEGVWVSKAYSEHFGAKEGDTICIDAGDGTVHQARILGFDEFWLTYNELVMTRNYYEKEFNTAFAPNAILADTGKLTVEDIKPALTHIEGFDSIMDDRTYEKGDFDSFSGVSSTVVLIYIALSILMAIVVLLNLNIMFIDEKKRELIVLMINGFSVKDAKRYIYNDTIVLTILGIICGIILGCIMGAVTVTCIEPITASFVKDINMFAVIIGALGSAILAFIMTIIALRRIPRFDLTDINKF